MSQLKQLKHLKIPLQDIKDATEDFHETNFIGRGGYGKVYKGNLSRPGSKDSQPVAVKRLDVTGYQGKNEFYREISLLSYDYKHENIVTLVGFCDDNNEMILVYEYMIRGSLDIYLTNRVKLYELPWLTRLKICVGVARGLDHLHNHVATEYRIIHRDVKSSNVLLDDRWNAKISDFGLSRIGLANQPNTFLFTNVAGTHGYCDPQYERTGILTKESDVYSFGVVLFEVLCGRLVCVPKYHDERRFLQHLARRCYKNEKIVEIVDFRIRKRIAPEALSTFSAIAYQCLQEDREERPKMDQVVKELEKALEIQMRWPSFVDKAITIQMAYRAHLIRKSRALRLLRELAIAKDKLKGVKALFHSEAYRRLMADDEEERQRYFERIIVLLLTVDSIEGVNAWVRVPKRLMVDELEKILDVVDPRAESEAAK